MISFPKFLHEINSLIVAQLNSNIVHFIISNRIFRNEFKISIAVNCRQFSYCLMAADICVSRKPPDICQSEGSQGYMLTSPHVSVVLYFSHAFISHTFQIINIICFCYIAHMVHSHVRLSYIFVLLGSNDDARHPAHADEGEKGRTFTRASSTCDEMTSLTPHT